MSIHPRAPFRWNSFLVSYPHISMQTLESDLLVVQSMVASRYSHFKKESLEWQRSLSFVSDVITMLNGIQVKGLQILHPTWHDREYHIVHTFQRRLVVGVVSIWLRRPLYLPKKWCLHGIRRRPSDNTPNLNINTSISTILHAILTAAPSLFMYRSWYSKCGATWSPFLFTPTK